MDKYLWAARFFKTRSVAGHACELGRVVSNGTVAKASREVRVGDVLSVTTDGGLYTVEVLGLSEMRGPAAVAQGLYRETEESQALRARVAEEKRAMPRFESAFDSRPTKKNRRELERLRGWGS